MKRSGFASKAPPRLPRAPLVPLKPEVTAALRRSDGRARLTITLPRPKEAPVRSEAYLRLVAAMDCAHCGRAGPSQACHGDEGKGMGIKSSDLTCWPGCADAPGRLGCHTLIGSKGAFTRAQRRALEITYAARTRAKIRAAGTWPKGVPDIEGNS